MQMQGTACCPWETVCLLDTGVMFHSLGGVTIGLESPSLAGQCVADVNGDHV
jgi:hypothetical protein